MIIKKSTLWLIATIFITGLFLFIALHFIGAALEEVAQNGGFKAVFEHLWCGTGGC